MMEVNILTTTKGTHNYPCNSNSLLVLWNQGKLYYGDLLQSNRSITHCMQYEIAVPSNCVLFDISTNPDRKGAFMDAATLEEAHIWLSKQISRPIEESSFRTFFVKQYPYRYNKIRKIGKKIDSIRRKHSDRVILGIGDLNTRTGVGVMVFPDVEVDMTIVGWGKKFSSNTPEKIKYSSPDIKTIDVYCIGDSSVNRIYRVRAAMSRFHWQILQRKK